MPRFAMPARSGEGQHRGLRRSKADAPVAEQCENQGLEAIGRASDAPGPVGVGALRGVPPLPIVQVQQRGARDQREMGEGLREIAEEGAGARIRLLRVKPDIVGARKEPLEEAPLS